MGRYDEVLNLAARLEACPVDAIQVAEEMRDWVRRNELADETEAVNRSLSQY